MGIAKVLAPVTGAPRETAAIGAWARNCIPVVPREPVPLSGRALLDILV